MRWIPSLLLPSIALGSCSPSRTDVPGPDAAPKTPASALSAAAAGETPPPSSGAARRVYEVAAVGDSLTDARAHGGKFLDLLRERCPESRFDNHGKGGEMVNQMRRRFARDVLGEAGLSDKPAYTHVIVFGGVNDLYSDKTALRSVPKIQADLSAMYAMAKQHGIRVVAVTVAPWGGFTRYYNAERAGTTRQLNAWILGREGAEVDHAIDAYALLSCGDPERLCPEYAAPFRDGLHFGQKGHARLGEAIHEEVFSDCR
jgi:lysophospholipase L1-like esterase